MFPLLVSKLEGPLGCVPIHISAYGWSTSTLKEVSPAALRLATTLWSPGLPHAYFWSHECFGEHVHECVGEACCFLVVKYSLFSSHMYYARESTRRWVSRAVTEQAALMLRTLQGRISRNLETYVQKQKRQQECVSPM